MDNYDRIIGLLQSRKLPLKEISSFSEKPGIYAVFFTGNLFPVEDYAPKMNEIIYVGKTESSSKNRDLNTHFTSEKTGSSTLRRTFGALLREKLNLKPIPRSETETSNKKFINFKFDAQSEQKLTQWMLENLGLAFYEISTGVEEIKRTETSLIKQLVPVLNLSGNSSNPYYQYLSAKRKECRMLAQKNDSSGSLTSFAKSEKNHSQLNASLSSTGENLYTGFWNKYLSVIKIYLKQSKSLNLQLSEHEFSTLGNRKSYAFKLELINGKVTNNIGGSAVARDQNKALNSNSIIKENLNGKHVIFRLSKNFTFSINYA